MYNGDKTWESVASEAAGHAQQLIFALNQGLNSYNEWQSFRAGRDNATIATALSKTTGQIAEIDACFSALKELYDYANNSTPSQGDRFYSLRIFA